VQIMDTLVDSDPEALSSGGIGYSGAETPWA